MNQDHRITEADNQESAPGDRPAAEGQPGQSAQPTEASSATQASEADSDEVAHWPGCAKCGLTLTCECGAETRGGTFWKDRELQARRSWTKAWSNGIPDNPAWGEYCGWAIPDSWASAVRADAGRHDGPLSRIIYRTLLRVKALYLLTH